MHRRWLYNLASLWTKRRAHAAGHGCQIDGMNYLVPCDSPLNVDVDDLVPLTALFTATKESSGAAIVVVDAARKIASGIIDGSRDTFLCPLAGTVMREPVKLADEPDGWTYESEALQAILHDELKSPLTGKEMDNYKTVPDEKLQQHITRYLHKSTLANMEPSEENCMLVLASAPNEFSFPPVPDPTSVSGRKMGLFTHKFLVSDVFPNLSCDTCLNSGISHYPQS